VIKLIKGDRKKLLTFGGRDMTHGGCCDCFVCKIGKFLGLVEPCGDNCCNEPKVKTKNVAKKKVAKKKTTSKKKK
jgi:hypothetical protein